MQSRIEYLFDCYVHQNCSLEEEKELMEYLAESENEVAIQDVLQKLIEDTNPEIKMPDEMAVSILNRILASDKPAVLSHRRKKIIHTNWITVAAAAVVFLFISEATYWFFSKSKKDKTSASIVLSNKKK